MSAVIPGGRPSSSASDEGGTRVAVVASLDAAASVALAAASEPVTAVCSALASSILASSPSTSNLSHSEKYSYACFRCAVPLVPLVRAAAAAGADGAAAATDTDANSALGAARAGGGIRERTGGSGSEFATSRCVRSDASLADMSDRKEASSDIARERKRVDGELLWALASAILF